MNTRRIGQIILSVAAAAMVCNISILYAFTFEYLDILDGAWRIVSPLLSGITIGATTGAVAISA